MSGGVVAVFEWSGWPGVLGCLRDPLCRMSAVLGAGWMGGESSPGAGGVL